MTYRPDKNDVLHECQVCGAETILSGGMCINCELIYQQCKEDRGERYDTGR